VGRHLHRGLLALTLLVTTPCLAATPEANHAAAVESFRRGTELVEAGKLQEAVDAFRDALQREPASVGARLDLADCYEKIGAPASAWREYTIAEVYARKGGDARQAMARSSAAGLEARLFVVRLEGKGPPGMALQLDGDPVAEEIVSRGSFALAPGRHHLEMTAPGKRPTSVELTGAAGETRALTVALEDAPPPSSARIEESSGAAPPRSSAQKTWGFVLGAVGIAGLGVGGVFGGLALAKRSTLESESLDPSVGSARFYSDRSNADLLAAVSTAGFIAGGVALAAGATLLATAPTGKRSGWIRVGPYVGGGGTGLVAGGEF
jgi:hypothetical protein